MNNLRRFHVLVALAMLISSCNKTDFIEPDQPNDGRRPITSASSPYQSDVFEYTPAPGQFIGDTKTGGFSPQVNTPAEACAYALRRLSNRAYVSLGAFGGYIVVGFDHSIVNTYGGYDFAIQGNAMDESNEPGIVSVMRDVNGNGLPDDEWFELAGSETGLPSSIRDYSVTYFRPAASAMPVEWVASDGTSGQVDYLAEYHNQEYYYPTWISANSYTLFGTKLEARNELNPTTNIWINYPFAWGYADNMGRDCFTAGTFGNGQIVGFKISNAIDRQGNYVNLPYIDFVKVQSAVMAQSGWIGENSCEVLSIMDYSMLYR